MRFRSSEEIQRHLAAQLASGLSVAAYFCKETICKNSFYNWRKRFTEDAVREFSAPVSFLKLPIGTAALERPGG